MINNRSRNKMRELRHRRLRKHISGIERPRLAVFGSLKIYTQVIDDVQGNTCVGFNDEQTFKDAKTQAKEAAKQSAS